ncbi:MAG: PKD domain-containing protein, partial [Chitinophagaceae bacterium]
MKKLILFFFLSLCFTKSNLVSSQVVCSSCTSNDFTFNSFYIGDINGNALSGSCSVGSPQTAYLWMNVTNSSTRYSLLVYYQLVEYNPITSTSTTNTYSNCLYDGVAIPSNLINLGTISWTCGNQLTISNFQMHWKQNNTITCSYDAPKCLCVPPTIIRAPLIASFAYTGCNNGATSTVNFTANAIGGASPYTYAWTFSGGGTSTLANPTRTYTNPGPHTATLVITDNVGVQSTYTQTITLAAQEAAPAISVTQPTCTVSTGTITVTSPIGAGFTYSRDEVNYQTSTTFSAVPTGSYNITYRNSSNCVSAPASATVNSQPSIPVAPTLSVTQPTCTVATGTITVSAPTGAGLEYSLDGVSYQTSTTFSGLSSGSYTVRVRNATSCVSSTTSATVNAQPPTPVAPTLSVTQPTCTVATGTITVSAPTGAGLEYSLDGV